MASHGEKPLPHVPPHRQQLSVLTVDSRAHLRRFVLQTLREEGIVREQEQWATALISALCELGTSISQGAWLPGFRRARDARKRREVERNARRMQQRLEKKGENEKTKPKLVSKMASESKVNDPESKQSASEHGSSRETPPSLVVLLQQLRELSSTHVVQQMPKPSIKHLLLMMEPYAQPIVPSSSDVGSTLTQQWLECVFTPNTFAFPEVGQEEVRNILYGLDEWDVRLYKVANEDCLLIVGGTFRLKGTASAAQHATISKVLRVCLYFYLALLLEQHLLSNSHVEIKFPKPAQSALASAPLVLRPSLESKPPKRESTVASGIWSFFSKKTETLLHHAASIGPTLARRGSLELPLVHPPYSQPSIEANKQRPRRFSFMSSTSPDATSPRNSDEAATQHPLLAALKHIDAYKDLLSTSPGLLMPLPSVLVSLTEKESQDPDRRLTADEKAALKSLLGWECKESLGRGMVGMSGFVRQQGISLLYSAHVPLPLITPQPPTPVGTASSSSAVVPPRLTACGNRMTWVTYRYYRRGAEADESLGEVISRLCATAEEPCNQPGCQFLQGDHDLRWIHGGVRIVATVNLLSSSAKDSSPEDDAVLMWESCAVCGRETRREHMSDGTYLYSFGKYLELLIYSPVLCAITPPLCEHTTIPPRPWPQEDTPLPRTRLNIHRRFACKSRTVTFSLSKVEDIFELRVPRLQIVRRRGLDKSSDKKGSSATPNTHNDKPSLDGDRRALRREIMRWWQGLSDHIDKLEENFIADTCSTRAKALPRLPSEDIAYDPLDESGVITPKASLSRLPSSTPTIAPISDGQLAHFLPAISSTASETISGSWMSLSSTSARSSTNSLGKDPAQLLSSLRHAFQKEEQNLYAELSRTPSVALNNVRRSFQAAARGASKRLSAWEVKHSSYLSKSLRSTGFPLVTEPDWWRSGCHAVPGGNVIVQEDDWGSIIAFTLSSMDYNRELAAMSNPAQRPTMPPVGPSTPVVDEIRSSFFRAGSPFGRLLPSHSDQPDPDRDDTVWQEPEAFSAVISRKEHPKDSSSMISFREALRHKASPDSPISATSRPDSSNTSAKGRGIIPPSARVKPAVELSMQAAGGHLNSLPDSADKILQSLGAQSNLALPSSLQYSGPKTPTSSSGFVETNIRRGKTASIISTDSSATADADVNSYRNDMPPPLPSKQPNQQHSKSEEHAHIPPATSSSITNSFTNTLASAMRYMLAPGESQRPRPASPHHGLLFTESPAIDDRPHIKYDWTIGKRLKFSCTVYYATQFDALRRRCGIEDVYIRSLARSADWAAEGGKSKSEFWKTADDQFIIKTLVNAWNVADLQVLIELGPSYFRYMDSTATKPSILAKLLGFYTVEIRNLESGATQAKADLLVMENLFYDRKVTKAFDLKGIQGRKVKASNSASKTLFDGEWIEDQRRALTLVRAYSKVVFQEAIKADCDFLARSNIMDYSLLLGVDEEKRLIACGLVDTIGSYTFAKTLEYKAKQGLSAGKEVTVVPPHEYQERFVSAMDDYFLACPDKWSRPLDGTEVPHDYKQLPSVL
ncbi:uncharacterized protein LAESUDRAFT_662877 [Laetiporus sulphureus 93-53]|uniref:PIPK domain-containing protein n=1 Tax=Laetiporus sulphureus 93-53 TaxID=1314785 RepID=A0A165BZX9_9APHY|nr:uncharacterized protein LAESUDRAFT_662877 [Laetiporus sulphureus 93-53]KZT01952.1 hypothetical protein LAESUDRAFT_662877 [Laetiporus sulphureus 93-53]